MHFTELVIASKNQGKVREFAELLSSVATRILSLPIEVVMPPETGSTFVDNALIKARAVSAVTGLAALADDSGLVVDFLGGAPGVYSARYGGEGLTDAQRTQLLLQQMEGVPWSERTAKFVAALALVTPDGEEFIALGECRGVVATAPVGNQGFGYDPIFYYPSLQKTFAEMTLMDKNAISHRTVALQKLLTVLKGVKAGD